MNQKTAVSTSNNPSDATKQVRMPCTAGLSQEFPARLITEPRPSPIAMFACVRSAIRQLEQKSWAEMPFSIQFPYSSSLGRYSEQEFDSAVPNSRHREETNRFIFPNAGSRICSQ
jgi:hypothetical protein